MAGQITNNGITKWLEILFKEENENKLIQDIFSDPYKFRKTFINIIAENLYEDMRRSRLLITAPFTINKDFFQLSADEQKIWFDYAAGIPEKLKALNLFIRPFDEFCRTCIITDDEIEKLAAIDHDQYFLESAAAGPVQNQKKIQETRKRINRRKVTYKEMPDARKWYFRAYTTSA
ncbi:MAG: hypothetical protein HZB98_07620 [Bacteroidia bacterium]|nr:hypothetical protein [Bacteroidia bacterium]